VLYLSVHRFGDGFYPGSGDCTEIGEGAGEGSTVNIPLKEGTDFGDLEYISIFQWIVLPVIRQFKPDFVS